MAVEAVSAGIVSRKFPENGKSTGKLTIFAALPDPDNVLSFCIFVLFF
jgi:hypothetical protein